MLQLRWSREGFDRKERLEKDDPGQEMDDLQVLLLRISTNAPFSFIQSRIGATDDKYACINF